MNELFEVKIDKMIFGGDGLARLPDGRAVFVPFSLPGEVMQLRLVEDKGRFLRALPVDIIEASVHRITPKCLHFGVCGGCHYQHMSYEKQLELKFDILKDQLERIGNINNPPLEGIAPSDNSWNYRNHIQFHINEDGKLGFKDINGKLTIPITDCYLPMEQIITTWKQIELEPKTGITRLSLREDSNNEVMLLFEGPEESVPELSLDLPVSASYQTPEGCILNLAGDEAQVFKIKDQLLRVSPESFFQVNTPQAENMVNFVISNLPFQKNLEILELYCGVGLFSIFLAPYAKNLTAIETSTSSCFDFAINLDSMVNVILYEASVEGVLPTLKMHPDLVLLDPPRSGLAKSARDTLLKLDPDRIIYVSCDPATLARDLKYFQENHYGVKKIKAFDMFPQTYHIESISILCKE